eukprot:gene29856-37241_t
MGEATCNDETHISAASLPTQENPLETGEIEMQAETLDHSSKVAEEQGVTLALFVEDTDPGEVRIAINVAGAPSDPVSGHSSSPAQHNCTVNDPPDTQHRWKDARSVAAATTAFDELRPTSKLRKNLLYGSQWLVPQQGRKEAKRRAAYSSTNAATNAMSSVLPSPNQVVEDTCTESYEEQAKHIPIFIPVTTAADVLVFVIYCFIKGQFSATTPIAGPPEWWFRLVDKFPGCNDVRHEIWRFFTYQ